MTTIAPANGVRRDAFDEYARTDATSLLRLAVLLAGERDDGADLAQECLARVAQAWQRGAPADPRAFARTVLVNLARDRWRTRGRRPRLVALAAEHDVATDPYAAVDLRDSLLRELARLPARQRAVLVLRFYEELSEAETAAAVGCSVSSVKTHTRRGLDRLRGQVGEEAR